MSSKTRIIVLHMKEIIYTAVFLALAVVLAVILFFMFGPGKTASDTASEKSRYKPGVYTSSITLNDNTFDVEVTVNADKIKAIRLVNLSETTKASYPLMEPVLDSLASQIYSSQSLLFTFRFQSSPTHPARFLHWHHLAFLSLLLEKAPHYLPSDHPAGRNA